MENNLFFYLREIRGTRTTRVEAAADPTCIYGELVIKHKQLEKITEEETFRLLSLIGADLDKPDSAIKSIGIEFGKDDDQNAIKIVAADLALDSSKVKLVADNIAEIINAKTYADNAKTSSETATTKASEASTSASNAKASEDKAKEYENSSKVHEIRWVTGGWTLDRDYTATNPRDATSSLKSSYICKLSHTSTLDTEPGRGKDWQDYWEVLASAGGGMDASVYDSNNSGVVDNAELVNGHSVQSDVPAGAIFSKNDFSDSHKTKLDNIENNAKDDQNASEVPFAANGDIASTNVQDAIVENRNDTDSKLATKFDKAGGTIGGSILVEGDISQTGSAYETHAEKVYTTNDEIILRDGAVAGLGASTAGIRAKKYDGTNDGILAFDTNGVARVGDDGSTQALATREDSPIDTGMFYWDNATSKMMSTKNINVDSVAVSGNIDGRDISVDGAKLDGIEANATADQIANEVPFTPTSTLTSTNVQDVISELESDIGTEAGFLAALNYK